MLGYINIVFATTNEEGKIAKIIVNQANAKFVMLRLAGLDRSLVLEVLIYFLKSVESLRALSGHYYLGHIYDSEETLIISCKPQQFDARLG